MIKYGQFKTKLTFYAGNGTDLQSIFTSWRADVAEGVLKELDEDEVEALKWIPGTKVGTFVFSAKALPQWISSQIFTKLLIEIERLDDSGEKIL